MRGRPIRRRAVFALVTAGAGTLALPGVARAADVRSIDLGGAPAAVAVNPVTGLAYVTDPESGTVSVIDPRGAAASAVITVGGAPGDVAVDARTNRVYVANPRAGTVVVLDGRTRDLVSVIGAGVGASALAVDEQADRVYAASGTTGTLAVLDGVSCTLAALVPGPKPSLGGIAVDPGRKLAYCASTGTDSVEVFSIDSGKFVASVKVGAKPTAVAVHHASGTVYVANSGIHHMSIVDAVTHAERKTVLLRSEASALTVHQGTNTVYTNGGQNGISRVDGGTGTLTGDLALGVNPGEVAIDERTRTVYVTDPVHGRVFLVRDF
ncbi:YncE family protein [Amycolatopsis australiensis]|uniref:40-residue YVTN family beta-propeller repeat-containing protein n=1 Tax=Amycolatopsis australiensis TaxID=546364 RepID=A0A1K1PHZ4_9PSEU|nr:YncE family protein [Amycolatopsis australiensis]SFW47081.1 40-residue YVTN family beta-propeller repeat-containing protein [Amycolatopsis australiensis]